MPISVSGMIQNACFTTWSSVQIVKGSLRVRKDIESRFLHCDGLVNLAHASLSVRSSSESGVLHCGGPVKRLFASQDGLFVSQEGPWKLFLLMWGSCESCAVHFGCEVWYTEPFSPLWRSCEACSHQFVFQIKILVKPGFRTFLDRHTGLHKLHRTVTMVKTAFWSLLTLKQACMSFTGRLQ